VIAFSGVNLNGARGSDLCPVPGADEGTELRKGKHAHGRGFWQVKARNEPGTGPAQPSLMARTGKWPRFIAGRIVG